jgi:hypothetical protein
MQNVKRTPLFVFSFFIFHFSFVLLTGCEGGSEALMPVRGKVSYRGKPLQTGFIVFSADSEKGTEGPVGFSKIDSDGGYAIKTGELEGIAPGWYRVTVTAAGENDSGIPLDLLPEKYHDPDLSGLECQVKRGHDNVADFDLE